MAASTAQGTMVLAATSTTSGGTGDYSATPLRPSGSWTAGGSSGDFTYSYPLQSPPSAGGLDPKLSLNYDSQSIDSETAATGNQASWIGDGWSMSPGSVTRAYVPCADDPAGTAPKVQDECWLGQVLHVTFGSQSADIVHDSSAPTGWRLSNDENEKVELLTGGNNGTYDGDYWKITTTDGTQYFFGLNRLPGWATGNTTTNSAWTVPVYGAHSGDPCYNATFSQASCLQAWSWNLDYVKAANGNAEAYYYKTEANYYGADNGTTGVSYTRGGYLDHVDYGFTDGHAYSASAPQRIQFTAGDRCVASSCDPISSNTANWPDVPYDLNCAQGASCSIHGPSFWTEERLTKITPEIYQNSAYSPVDTYTLSQSFHDPGDGTTPALWLDSITHTGNEGGSIQLPALTFTGEKLINRVNTGDGYPDMVHYRISGITTETGDQISVAYSSPSCTPVSDPSTNTGLCYPVYWALPGQSTPTLDWFNKFVVASVTDNDSTGGSPGTVTSYKYLGNPAWHYDDNEVVKAKYRTWGQWRGYPEVQTMTGSTTDGQTRSNTRFFQGMDGDTLPGGKTRSVSVKLSSDVTVPGAQASTPDKDQLAGRPREVITYKGVSGDVVGATVNDYWVSAPTATRTRGGLPDLTATIARPTNTYTTTAITSTSPETWRSTEADQGYDPNTGLLLFTDDHGDISKPAQETCTSLTYAPANTTANILGLVAESETDQGACATGNSQTTDGLGYPTSVNRPTDVISDVRTFYDTNPTSWPVTVPAFPQTTPPTVGKPSIVEKAGDYSNGAFTYQIAAASAFDSYGRVTDAWDGLGNDAHTDYTTTAGLTTKATTTDQLGHATTTTLDPTRALPTAVVDPNGAETDTTYDALGRIASVWLPNRSKSSQTASYTYTYTVSATAPTAVTTNTLLDNGTYSASIDLYDALLRERQTQTPTPKGGRLLTDNFYDSHGWLTKVNHGYWDGSNTPSTTLDTATTDNVVPNQDVITFDGDGRPTLDVSKHLSNTVSQTQTVYGGDHTTVIPPTGGKITSTATDARGRTTEVDNYTAAPSVNGDQVTGGTFVKSLTSYDASGSHGQISTLTSPSGAQRTFSYNLLGEKTQQDDPDTGTTHYAYDANGHLQSTTDAKNATLYYTYDALGRPAAVYNGTSTSAPLSASWTYDGSSVPNSIGRQTSASSYDNSGNLISTTGTIGFTKSGKPTGTKITIPGSVTGLAGSYAYTYAYSSNTELPKSVTYPAAGSLPAETVNTGYNVYDLPNSVGGLNTYTGSTSYDAYSRVLSTTLGLRAASAVLGYSFDDHTGDVTEVNTQRYTAPATVDDTKYTYDPVGHITRTTDSQNNATTVDTQCYQYDGLDRLAQAWTATDQCAAPPTTSGSNPNVGGPNPYWSSWEFTDDGNRQTQVQHAVGGAAGDTTTAYHYGQPTDTTKQPDTLTSTITTLPDGTQTGATYSYDADGNTTTRTITTTGTDTFTWDNNGKLTSLKSTGQTNPSQYQYDPDGNLLIQTDPAGKKTLYLPHQDVTYDPSTSSVSGTRYIPLPGGTTCVRSGSGTSYSFQTSNYQGTSSLALDQTAQAPTFRSFDAYGNPRGTQPATWYGNKGFVGGTQDSTTNLTNLGAREYDAALGRFISADPYLEANDPDQIGGYAYAGDNPVTHSDPAGLWIDDGTGHNEPRPGGGPAGRPPAPGIPRGGTGPDGCYYSCGYDTSTGGSGTAHGSGGGGGNGGGGHHDCGWNPLCYGNEAGGYLWAHKAQIVGGAAGLFAGGLCYAASGATAEEGVGFALATQCGAFAGAVGSFTENAVDPHGDHSAAGTASAIVSGGVIGGATGGLAEGAGQFLASRFDEGTLANSLGRLLSGSGGCNSFTATTVVEMANGAKKAISAVTSGQTVLATDPLTGKTKPEKVTATIVTKGDTDFTDLTVHTAHGDSKITSTQHHPYWDITRQRWANAGDLHIGDHLRDMHGGTVTVATVRNYTTHLPTYNLTVNELHTYYVLAGATPVLVHNCNGDDPQSAPGGKNGAALSIKKVKMALGRAGMSVSDYDIVHVPEISTAGDGLPSYGNSPHDGNGMPNLGPRGRPVIQISNMGLDDMDTAVATIFHEIYHHQMFATWPDSMGGTESAAETYGQAMLGVFRRRTGR
ncbi:polymorphic toxin-type HINT domain-containing protein [Streptomyces mirabilis]|uniref:polymorphic toxin-type HINT domain-containing protein n=1 Tax=Streptomyces mirabilis TaxID=68239 RepID=UPI0022521726|nr:polymorphic toxin-type HINT domain-containing protein [Streptomyces mirabilis]MCX4425853.1 polymorphic toxin-type HINT domain-containing protein [Streptomyces mirabilis]